jgi:hypothetical protein
LNAVEIEEAISNLAEQPFDAESFPYAFLEAFGNKEATLKRLKSSNESDVDGGVLQRNNIHIAVCPAGQVNQTLNKLRLSPATAKSKAKFILATDGVDFEAEDLTSDDSPIVCKYEDFPNHFGLFLALAGISTVKQIRESSFDIRATSRLNRLYVELLQTNPEWGTSERRHDMNHFMGRLIFCFFAEDTDIFNGKDLFTGTVEQMSAKDASDTHEIISEIFRAMNTKVADRQAAGIKRWAEGFPYVNGGLFSGSTETPRFSKIARSYLIHVGQLDWTRINPDIFGSMIQAVADDDERGSLGMHYTSVPNILKVLNPLFLDDLRAELTQVEGNPRKLLNLKKRMTRIRVFDPACGSGNFLVIAYKQMREIEAEINKRRGELHLKSEIPLTNFRGIELRDFSAEVARLALIIAEYQCDVTYIGQKEALQAFLPLDSQNWITSGNALRLDWLSICPSTGTGVKVLGDDLFNTPDDQAEIDFDNEGGETYICGNPPYQGSVEQTAEQKAEMKAIFSKYTTNFKDLDYVCCWFIKAAEYMERVQKSASSLVSTNSICQGEQVAMLWPNIFSKGIEIIFAHTSFEWANLAANNAGVTCIIVGLGTKKDKKIFSEGFNKNVSSISPYLIEGESVIVNKVTKPISSLPTMATGNLATDGGNLLLSYVEKESLLSENPLSIKFIKKFLGANELTNGKQRWCLWIMDEDLPEAESIKSIGLRIKKVEQVRKASRGSQAKGGVSSPHRFVFTPHKSGRSIVVPKVSTSSREYMPSVLCDDSTIVSDLARVIYECELWNLSILSSKIHLVWIGVVCGRFRTGFRYSQTLGWNTFPIPVLTEKNKEDLSRCAQDILLAREAHFPATISELYEPENMPENLRYAHERNDEVLERIYIGRRFKNDTERLEKLFELYTKMTTPNKKVN